MSLLAASVRAARIPAISCAVALLAASCGAPSDAGVVYVSTPGLRLADWLDCDGVAGRRFTDEVARRGWTLAPGRLSKAETEALDHLAARTADTLRVEGAGGRDRGAWVGPNDGGVYVRFEGQDGAGSTVPPPDLARESAPWVDREDHLRWEEIPEMLQLTGAENLAFRNATGNEAPLAALKRAYLRDKRVVNLAIWLLGTRRPRMLSFALDLARVYGEVTLPYLADARSARNPVPPPARAEDGRYSLLLSEPEVREEAAGAGFEARIEASRTRVAGRCDRIFQSITGEAPRGSWILVDARRSPDPFVAVLKTGQKLADAAAALPLNLLE